MRTYIFILLITLIGCKDKGELILINPVNNYEGRIDSIEFNWSTTEVGSQRLIISSYNFREILYDTILSSNSFIANDFKPNTKYNWKVIINNLEGEAKFTTLDPLDSLLDEYIIETTETLWGNGPVHPVYTYADTVRFEKNDDGLTIQHGRGAIKRSLTFYNYSKNRYSYGYHLGYLNGSEMHINIVDREINIKSLSGGLGSGKVYESDFSF